ncbi:hypothetical protein N7489_005715 [Penicillium chrysogenum]|jgi:hypothetical protein|uniref:Uncharacterized protein n=1 Tax=Penicillium chrysogenum TaxID=5076 RepID=A0A167YQV7_PENCH|nr:uncharacterized protein N7489_005715 [Penicillium chrysogenum]XP_061067472.1 uncharacterized protein N7525_010095 [Penicillium rubens]KAJ5035808.1 hypothetical protein NUH16_003668 [Penicillium rubens]KAJ5245619.1 hypothetical protein N7489_005715 [Penicillium chrysogenum]KAJ5274290.1 hypothetical protein N7505_002835 [Penicillium chrysogenum]KAJ5284756.1 hypothetical protein N7524_000062 [Penicillium chrysogenum]KAJ5820811.1 hypothetical protein N7525_010095 [Penicillium rubens]
MADNRPIPTLADEELEGLTRARVRFAQRRWIRSLIVREGQAILDWDIFLSQLNQYLLPTQYLQYVRDLLGRRWMTLLDVLEQVRLQEDRDNATMGWWQE